MQLLFASAYFDTSSVGSPSDIYEAVREVSAEMLNSKDWCTYLFSYFYRAATTSSVIRIFLNSGWEGSISGTCLSGSLGHIFRALHRCDKDNSILKQGKDGSWKA